MLDLLSSSGIFWLCGVFGILVCCKQFLGNQEVFCCVVDYTIGFSELYIYCRVSSSCDTIAEIKERNQSCLVLFSYLFSLLWTTEYFISVFYSHLFFFFFSFLSLRILVYLWKRKSRARYSLCERSPDKWVGGILIPGKDRAFLHLTYLLFYHLKYYYYFYHTKQKLEHCKTSISACPETALSVKKRYVMKVYN